MATSLGSTFEDDLADLGDSSGVTKCLGCGKDTEKGNRRELGTKSSLFIIPKSKVCSCNKARIIQLGHINKQVIRMQELLYSI